jgi:hypothetical protein
VDSAGDRRDRRLWRSRRPTVQRYLEHDDRRHRPANWSCRDGVHLHNGDQDCSRCAGEPLEGRGNQTSRHSGDQTRADAGGWSRPWPHWSGSHGRCPQPDTHCRTWGRDGSAGPDGRSGEAPPDSTQQRGVQCRSGGWKNGARDPASDRVWAEEERSQEQRLSRVVSVAEPEFLILLAFIALGISPEAETARPWSLGDVGHGMLPPDAPV